MGCRQAVRHWTLTPTLRRFESYHPSHSRKLRWILSLLSQISLDVGFLRLATNRKRLCVLSQLSCEEVRCKQNKFGLNLKSKVIKIFYNGVSPSGKAQDFDSCIRWFKSSYPSHRKFRRNFHYRVLEKCFSVFWKRSKQSKWCNFSCKHENKQECHL